MEIAKHGITTPAAEDPDVVRINSAKEKRHGAAGAQRTSGNVSWVNASMASDRESGCMEEASDHGTSDGTFAGIVKVHMKQRVGRSLIGVEALSI